MADAIQVTVWNEYRHEKTDERIAQLYPEGMHGAIAKYLRSQPGLKVRTATLDEPEHGLTDEVLAGTCILALLLAPWNRKIEDHHRPLP